MQTFAQPSFFYLKTNQSLIIITLKTFKLYGRKLFPYSTASTE